MLQLKNIVKNYYTGDVTVKALAGVSVSFRKNEFVSILGASGCGKTTLLNIVGGLDRYTDGDLVINGRSTKGFKDKDWDSYRNHSVGFVFQSYNLIPHQSVLKNVELALTLSGIKREERRQRAKEALERVGLGDQLSKKPNQLSGGQMQRVAIARAIVNNPDIILADEPTGALDTETSVQVMEILKEISETKLVIMVTHNPELASEYSTRIINLKDGEVVGDTAPYDASEEVFEKVNAKEKKPSMSFFTALSLSLNNLATKKARTILTSFAGSIGIIGIALILSLSSGFNAYINKMQEDTLSNYPVTVSSANVDLTAVITSAMGTNDRGVEKYPEDEKVTTNETMTNMLNSIVGGIYSNDLSSFKTYIEEKGLENDERINDVKYVYNLNLSIYSQTTIGGAATNKQIQPITLPAMPDGVFGSAFGRFYEDFQKLMASSPAFTEMMDNSELIESQYELLKGKYAEEPNEVVLVVDDYNQIDDMTLYMLGFLGDNDIMYVFTELSIRMQNETDVAEGKAEKMTDEQIEQAVKMTIAAQYGADANGEPLLKKSKREFSFDDILEKEYSVLLPFERYVESGKSLDTLTTLYREKTAQEIDQYISEGKAETIKIAGILRKRDGITAGAINSSICYTEGLANILLAKGSQGAIYKDVENELVNSYVRASMAYAGDAEKIEQNAMNFITTPIDFVFSKERVVSAGDLISVTEYATLYSSLGICDEDKPSSIEIYPTSFESKDFVIDFIDEYNASQEENKQIKYTDYIGLLMSSVTVIINAITYILIAFVSISLVVSSIMIGIITYISVLERTKEIGVLRSIGASKRDIKRVFNAETIIIGFVSGAMGIIITLILNIPVNLIINSLSGLVNVAVLPWVGAVVLIAISVLLTTIAGLFPASIASKKDPVIALRTE